MDNWHLSGELAATLDELLAGATGVTCHSQKVRQGFIFVAIPGYRTDGRLFIPAALQAGATAIVTEDLLSLPPPLRVVRVPDARRALAYLAAAFYGHPSRRLAVTGVTGSNGKTTITYMLAHIWRCAGRRAGLIGTMQVQAGNLTLPSSLTTPDAADLQRYLRLMADSGVSHVATEVSAQGLVLQRVAELHLSCGVMTNICPDHLDFYGSFAAYLAAKERFFSLLPPSAPAVVNVDDPRCRAMCRLVRGPLLRVGRTAAADLILTEVTPRPLAISFTLQPAPRSEEMLRLAAPLKLFLPVPGVHNAYNAALAAAAALVQGIPATAVRQALATFAAVPRRMMVYRAAGLTIVDDTALNPGSIDAVFSTLAGWLAPQLIVVNAVRGQRGTAINQANAATLAAWQRKLSFLLFTTDSAEAVADSDLVTAAEREAFLTALYAAGGRSEHTNTLAEAINLAVAAAAPGMVLVLLGAQGMDKGAALLARTLGTQTAQLEPSHPGAQPAVSSPCAWPLALP